MQAELVLYRASNEVRMKVDNVSNEYEWRKQIAELRQLTKENEVYQIHLALQSKMNAPGFVEDEY